MVRIQQTETLACWPDGLLGFVMSIEALAEIDRKIEVVLRATAGP